jgi:hypothetical protein
MELNGDPKKVQETDFDRPALHETTPTWNTPLETREKRPETTPEEPTPLLQIQKEEMSFTNVTIRKNCQVRTCSHPFSVQMASIFCHAENTCGGISLRPIFN